MRFRFFINYANFPYKKSYDAKRYIHVTQEDTEDSLFVLDEAPLPSAGAEGIGDLAVYRNYCTDGAEAKDFPNLLSGRMSNLCLEDMAELLCQEITVDNDNDLAQENFPREGETTSGTGNWRREGIICPQKAVNLQNSFASSRHYSHDAVLCMSLLQLFLIIFPEDYH